MCITVGVYSTTNHPTKNNIAPDYFIPVGSNTAGNVFVTILASDY